MKNKHHFFLLKGSGELGDYGLNFIFLEVFIFTFFPGPLGPAAPPA